MDLSVNKYKLPELHIGNKTARLPIIQGGMGVGVSLSSLAGAVAKEGGVGIISTAQIGYDDDAFEYDQAGCNLAAIKKHIRKAKEISGGNGIVGVNIMVALKHYKEHVKAAVAAGADVIISGAGLPIDLPALVDKACQTKIAPIVSSKRAAQLILKMWSHKYDRTADFIVIEGPKAGGHLGFSNEQLNNTASLDFDNEITNIIECKKEYEDKYSKKIPVIVAGGIFDKQDIIHAIKLGADSLLLKNVMHHLLINRLISMPDKKTFRLSKVLSECLEELFAMHLLNNLTIQESLFPNVTIVLKNVTLQRFHIVLQKLL